MCPTSFLVAFTRDLSRSPWQRRLLVSAVVVTLLGTGIVLKGVMTYVA
jgi:hypothetical protein